MLVLKLVCVCVEMLNTCLLDVIWILKYCHQTWGLLHQIYYYYCYMLYADITISISNRLPMAEQVGCGTPCLL